MIESVDDYIAAQPEATRATLDEIRRCVLSTAPDTEESIAYDMAGYRFANGRRFYFAGWQRHVSLHGVPEFDGDLEAEIAPYRSGAGTVKFPHRKPVPFDLIERVVQELQRPERAKP